MPTETRKGKRLLESPGLHSSVENKLLTGKRIDMKDSLLSSPLTLSGLTGQHQQLGLAENTLLHPLSLKTKGLVTKPKPKDREQEPKPRVRPPEEKKDETELKLCDWLKGPVTTMELASISEGLTFELTLSSQANPDSSGFFDGVETSRPDCRAAKMTLVQIVASSVFNERSLNTDAGKAELTMVLNGLRLHDPEFLLKAALYCRCDLNIRMTTNFLIATACTDEIFRPFVDKYFREAIRLPSDWLEVATLYKKISGSSAGFPKVLRRNLVAKFPDFDEYQLAKYNKQKRKRTRKKSAVSKPTRQPLPDTRSPPLTLKQMIRTLHIHQPTYPVVCILGKSYPASAAEFRNAGLEGDWDPLLAGKRMKLPTPMTWETELSAKGNYAHVWEELIESGKLPYMAMLRNLRNIIKSGVSQNVHDLVLSKLTNKRAVISSKQFPFRFFTAYVALQELERKYQFNDYLLRLIRSSSKRKSGKGAKVYKRIKEPIFVKASKYSLHTVTQYREALGTAIEIAIQNNLPPIRGSTLIICARVSRWASRLESTGLGQNLRTVSLLLGMMCASKCESYSMYISHPRSPEQLSSLRSYMATADDQSTDSNSNILERVQKVFQTSKNVPYVEIDTLVQHFYAMQQRFDTVLVLGRLPRALVHYVRNCRQHFGPVNAVWANLEGSSYFDPSNEGVNDWVMVKGATDLVLRYIAETSNNALLEHIERIDELYGLEQSHRVPFVRKALTDSVSDAELQIERPISDWRCCRVFISSTFRDMHAERDLICGLIIPNIRQFAARELRVHVNEVDLRWGVPEPATRNSQALQMCLEQASIADLFILLVGERYGWVPKPALVNSLPKPILRQLDKFYTPGMSVTEMEYRLAKRSAEQRVPAHVRRNNPNKSHEAITQRIHAFVRASDSLDGVPALHKLDFEEQRTDKAKRLQAFKDLLKTDGVIVLDSYPAWFNGVIADRPVMGNLTELGQKLSRCLHDSLHRLYRDTTPTPIEQRSLEIPRSRTIDASFLRIFVEPVASAIAPRQLLQLEKAFVELQARGKQCRTVRLLAAQKIGSDPKERNVRQTPSLSNSTMSDGAVLLVTGSAGCGKTTHLAALSMTLSLTNWSPRQLTGNTAFDVADPRSKLLGSQSSGSTTFPLGSQRPKLERFISLPQFVDGLASTGLAPKPRLADVLDCWIEHLLADAEAAASRSNCLTKQVSLIKYATEPGGSSSTGSIPSPDALLRIKVLRFVALLKLVGNFVGTRYAFVLDGADHIQPTIFDWLPDVLPENVRFVISCEANSATARQLAARPDCLALSIGGLTTAERSAAVRVLFGQYGKVLRESTFGNQLSVLVNKRNAEIPLYLRLACDELRLYGKYEELDSQLRALPDTMPKLVQHMVARVQADCGSGLTLAALAFMCCTQRPLATDELHLLLDSWLLSTRSKSSTDKDPWESLEKELPPLGSVAELMNNERAIESLLKSNDSSAPRKVYLPPLAFYTLLGGLRPLLAGLGDEGQTVDEENEDHAVVTPKGWLRFRSPEIQSHIRELVFAKKGDMLSSYFTLGFHQTSRSLTLSDTAKRQKVGGIGDEVTDGQINEKFIHWLLATRLSDLEYKIFHLFHAGKFYTVCRLLTSSMYLISKFRAGLGTSILEDFQMQGTADSEVQEQWLKISQADLVKVRLAAIHTFVGMHNSILSRYPFLFGELAINQEADKWLQQLGHAYLFLTNNSDGTSPVRLFIRASHPSDELALPIKVNSPPGADNITAVTVTPDNSLVIYGNSTGMITVAELGTFREIRSLFGHQGAITSLCFLTTDARPSGIMSSQRSGSQWQLVSTAQDGSIYLWNLETSVSTSGRLQLYDGSRIASLTGVHRRAVTASAWHPERELLATSGLDCLLVLWSLSRSELETVQTRFRGQSSLPPRRVFSTGFVPINCVAFRLPTDTMLAQESKQHSLDVVALGCWDGSVHIYDLIRLKKIKVFNASNYAISSLLYSPNGGELLATQDVRGQLSLWESTKWTLLNSFTRVPVNPHLSVKHIFPDPIDCQHGQLCFSRPNGRFLIQSGSTVQQNGYLSVWNAQLGASLSPWRKLDTPSRPAVTAFTVDPYGHFVLTGSAMGALAVTCSQTARALHTSDNLKPGQRSRAQCIACSLMFPRNSKTEYTLLVVLGLSNGLVQTYECKVQVPGSECQQGSSKSIAHCGCNLAEINLLYTSTCHSTGTQENLVAQGGGTLCVTTHSQVTVSGGGNAVCEVVFHLYSRRQNHSGSVVHHLTGIDSAVTAVATKNRRLAVATKNRTVRIYLLFEHEYRLCISIPNAALDWITSLVWSDIQSGRASRDSFLVVGSNDFMVHTYKISDNKCYRKLGAIDGPGGPITSLSAKDNFVACGSMEGSVKLLKISPYNRVEPLTTLDANQIGTGDQRLIGTVTSVNLFNEYVEPTKVTEDKKSSEAELPKPVEDTPAEDMEDVIDDLTNLFEESTSAAEQKTNEQPQAAQEGRKNSSSSIDNDSWSEMDTSDHSHSDTSSEEENEEGELEEETPVKVKSYQSREQTSCLMSLGTDCRTLLSDTNDATNLRLIIGTETVRPSTISQPSSNGPYHYRIVAPLKPELRALAQGHSGAIATSLAALDSEESTACFISVAKGQNSNVVAADLRQWCVPITECDRRVTTVEHTGPITCVSRFRSTNPVDWCASGGTDGQVIFHRASQKLYAFSISFTCHSIQPVVPITSLIVFSTGQLHFVYVAAGTLLWLLIIPDEMMPHLETVPTWDVNELDGLTSPNVKNTEPVKVLRHSFSSAIIELCPFLQDSSPIPCELLVSLGNASLAQIIFEADSKTLRSVDKPELIGWDISLAGRWSTSWHPIGPTSALCFLPNTPLILSKKESKLCLEKLWSDAALNALGSIKHIEPLGTLSLDGSRECYLIVALSDEACTAYVLDRESAVLFKSEPIYLPMTVTAACSLREVENHSVLTDEKFLLMLATSDGILHLLECDCGRSSRIFGPTTMRQVGLYPTGDLVTKVQLLQQKPLKVLVGSQTGRLDVFSIV